MHSIVVTVVATLGVLVLLDTLVWHVIFSRGIRRAPPPAANPEKFPSITVIRPIRGRDVGQEENLRAALDTGYPGWVETLFVFDDESDPGLAGARAAVAEHEAAGRPGTAKVLVVGPPPVNRTGKLNAMVIASGHAKGELIAFGDSDSRPTRGLLTKLACALLANPKNGSSFAPALVPGRLKTAGDVGYALMLNGLYGPAVARAAKLSRHALPFIMGQIMVFRREALASVGGVACATGQLVDDMHIGKCLHEAGWRNIMIKGQLPILTGGLTLREFSGIYRRWLLFSKGGLPGSFLWPLWLRGVEFYLSLGLVVVALAAGAPLWALPPALAFFAQGLSIATLQRRFGGPKVPLRHAWITWCIFLAALVVVPLSMLRQDVGWRGRNYNLRGRAELDDQGSATAAE